MAQLSPLPGDARVLEFGRTGRTIRFQKEREAGLDWICPQVESLVGGSDPGALLAFLRMRFEGAGYQTLRIVPLGDGRGYRHIEVYKAIHQDRSHEVVVHLSDGDTSFQPPSVFRLTWEQRCNG